MKEIEIIYEDRSLVVVNKPSGLAVHNGPTNLINILVSEFGERLKPVHRLDQETSGIILLARGAKGAARLQQALVSSESSKEYFALVRGKPPQQVGDWTAQISPKAEGRKNPAGPSKDRVQAHTHFEVIAQTPWLSMLKCQLLTGRQHQIRKHAALAGCYIVGDRRYGDPKHVRMISHRFKFNGLALHASQLTITHHDRQHTFTAPPPTEWEVFGFESL